MGNTNGTRKVALEEHYVSPDFVGYWRKLVPIPDALAERLLGPLSDLGDRRIEMMDAAGIELAVLSIAGPVTMEPDSEVAVRRASQANDELANIVAQRPSRYAGLATLPLQDPQAAADELTRCVSQLGFKGAMVIGHVQGRYLDDPMFYPFWERAAALDVPVYLHPAPEFRMPYCYEGRPELIGPTWSWTVETASHALRIVFGGIFERFPGARMMLGHMGEALPFMLWRLDRRFKAFGDDEGSELRRPPSEYIRRNISVTTSGVCSMSPLLCALAELGEDNVMFATDYPFESVQEAVQFIDGSSIDESLRRRICSENAARHLAL